MPSYETHGPGRTTSLLETINTRTGARRFYINGRRVTRDTMAAAKMQARLDTFHTITRGHIVRHRCEATRVA